MNRAANRRYAAKTSKIVGTVCLLLALVGPQDAVAGSAEDPEIVDGCGSGAPNTLQTYTPEADLCTGWFRGVWDPVYDDDGRLVDYDLRELVTTLEMFGNVEDRRRHYHYEMGWSTGPCWVGWFSKDYLDSEEALDSRFSLHCGDEPGEYFTIAPSDISYSDNRITVTMAVDRLPPAIRETLTVGTVLQRPRAWTLLQFQATVYYAESTYTWDSSPEAGGRSFVIGQDKPPIPPS